MGADAPCLKNQEAELACLGACLLDPDAAQLVAAELRPHDFTLDTHLAVHRAMVAILSRQQRLDVVTLATELRALKVDSPALLANALYDAVPTAALVRQHIRLVKQATVRRQVRAACQRTLQAMEDPEVNVSEAVAHWQEDVESYQGSTEAGRAIVPIRLSDGLSTWRRSMDNGERPPRIRTPFPKLNACLGGGLTPGRLVYLGAKASVGKTSFALQIARLAGENGFGVGIASLEMPEVDGITTRMLAQASKVSELTIAAGTFSDQEFPRMANAYSGLGKLPIWITDKAVRLPDICHLAEHWPFTPPISLLIIDYLQLVKGTAGENRRLEVESISRELKLLAVRCNIPVLCVASLKRTGKDDEDEPTLSDLKETGQLEYDGDVIAFLHRGFNSSEAKLIVAKNKYGPVGTAPLRFDKAWVSFEQVGDEDGR